MAENIPEGEFYARLYVKLGAPTSDSDRFRRRLSAYFERTHFEFDSEFVHMVGSQIEIETGHRFSQTHWAKEFNKFFEESSIYDVFAALTIIWKCLNTYRKNSEDWRRFIERTFIEESLSYRVDSKCGIHPAIDQEFDRNRASSLATLSTPRYTAVLHAAESAFKQLEAIPMNGKGAARDIFEAAESMTKIVCGTGSSLDEGFVNKDLRRVVDKCLEGDEQLKIDAQLKRTINSLLSSFGKWVDAVHPFRHGHDREQPLVLPDDVAVLSVSQGASFLRWLADLDRRVNK